MIGCHESVTAICIFYRKEKGDIKMYEIQEIVDFANMVFSMSAGSTNFPKLLPKAYSGDRHKRLKHHVIEEHGRIKGLIDVYPFMLQQENLSLQAGYIGTVSVHPSCEGQGYMKQLMKQAEQQAREDDMDLLVLDGARHRYQYYGFEKAGIKYCFNITDSSLKHGCKKYMQENRNLCFELIEEPSDYLDVMYACYQKRYVTARNKEDFLVSLQSWNASTYVVLENEECIGYVNVSYDERNIYEIGLLKASDIYDVLLAWDREFCVDEVGINVGADETKMISLLESMSDYFTVNMSHQIKILKYEKVLQFLLTWKSRYSELEKTRFVIGIIENNVQKNFACEVTENAINVTGVTEDAQLVLESKEFIKYMTTTMYWNNEKSDKKKTPEGWFPLPFFLPEADAF